jgi:hypothetical protein
VTSQTATSQTVTQNKYCEPSRDASTHVVRLEQSHADLHAPPLAIARGGHALVQVNVQQLHQLAPTLRVNAIHTKDHLARSDVTLQIRWHMQV